MIKVTHKTRDTGTGNLNVLKRTPNQFIYLIMVHDTEGSLPVASVMDGAQRGRLDVWWNCTAALWLERALAARQGDWENPYHF